SNSNRNSSNTGWSNSNRNSSNTGWSNSTSTTLDSDVTSSPRVRFYKWIQENEQKRPIENSLQTEFMLTSGHHLSDYFSSSYRTSETTSTDQSISSLAQSN